MSGIYIKKANASREKPLYKCGNLYVLLTLRNSNNTDVYPSQNYLTMFQCHGVNVEINRICDQLLVFEWDHAISCRVNYPEGVPTPDFK